MQKTSKRKQIIAAALMIALAASSITLFNTRSTSPDQQTKPQDEGVNATYGIISAAGENTPAEQHTTTQPTNTLKAKASSNQTIGITETNRTAKVKYAGLRTQPGSLKGGCCEPPDNPRRTTTTTSTTTSTTISSTTTTTTSTTTSSTTTSSATSTTTSSKTTSTTTTTLQTCATTSTIPITYPSTTAAPGSTTSTTVTSFITTTTSTTTTTMQTAPEYGSPLLPAILAILLPAIALAIVKK